MNIAVISATGTGHTELSSFDTALKNAGVLNYNLIPLSSVIPEGASVEIKKKYTTNDQTIGDRLFVVMAQIRTSDINAIPGSGLGWYAFDRGGVFVEHEVIGFNEQSVKEELSSLISASIKDLCKNRDEVFKKDRLHMLLSICPAQPIPRCALTVAVFQSMPW